MRDFFCGFINFSFQFVETRINFTLIVQKNWSPFDIKNLRTFERRKEKPFYWEKNIKNLEMKLILNIEIKDYIPKEKESFEQVIEWHPVEDQPREEFNNIYKSEYSPIKRI